MRSGERPVDDSAHAEEWCKSVIDQVCGADGILNFTHVRSNAPSLWKKTDFIYNRGDTYYMDYDEIHSIKFAGGSIVLFVEGPQKVTSSMMLEPWANGKVVPTFRTAEWMFEKA